MWSMSTYQTFTADQFEPERNHFHSCGLLLRISLANFDVLMQIRPSTTLIVRIKLSSTLQQQSYLPLMLCCTHAFPLLQLTVEESLQEVLPREESSQQWHPCKNLCRPRSSPESDQQSPVDWGFIPPHATRTTTPTQATRGFTSTRTEHTRRSHPMPPESGMKFDAIQSALLTFDVISAVVFIMMPMHAISHIWIFVSLK